MTNTMTEATTTLHIELDERNDLLDALSMHRGLLRQTAAGLTDEQARMRTTASRLSVGGIIKHVAATEAEWAAFIIDGTLETDDDVDWSNPDTAAVEAHESGFRLSDDESVTDALARYAQIAAATDQMIAQIDDLSRSFPLPPAPWFAPGAQRSRRRTIVHIIAETAQHAGHADIIREAIDGAKTMG